MATETQAAEQPKVLSAESVSTVDSNSLDSNEGDGDLERRAPAWETNQ